MRACRQAGRLGDYDSGAAIAKNVRRSGRLVLGMFITTEVVEDREAVFHRNCVGFKSFRLLNRFGGCPASADHLEIQGTARFIQDICIKTRIKGRYPASLIQDNCVAT